LITEAELARIDAYAETMAAEAPEWSPEREAMLAVQLRLANDEIIAARRARRQLRDVA
jgi:hypothetical protein